MAPLSEYRDAYEKAKKELADLLSEQVEIERRIVLVRQSLETLAALSESEGVKIKASREAAFILERTTLADDIRKILAAAWPADMRPHQVKGELEKLGRDLEPYQNPQATIHMVLRRIAESGHVEELTTPEGKKTYRAVPLMPLDSRFTKRFKYGGA